MAAWFYEGFSLFTAVIDFVVPTAVMFFLVSIIKPPPNTNLKRVLTFVYQFVYSDEKVIFHVLETASIKSLLPRPAACLNSISSS